MTDLAVVGRAAQRYKLAARGIVTLYWESQ